MNNLLCTFFSSLTRVVEFFGSSPCLPPPARLELCRVVAVRRRRVGGGSPYSRPRTNSCDYSNLRHFALVCSTLGALAFGSSAFAQNVTVTGSTGADGSYATLTAAFTAINANTTQTGNTISVSIVGDTAEGTGTAVLNQPSGGSWTSLTITPSGARTI